MNIPIHIFPSIYFAFLLEMKFVNQWICICSALVNTSELFSKVNISISILSVVYENSNHPSSPTTHDIVRFVLNFNQSEGYTGKSLLSFICIFLKINDIKHFFMLIDICIFPFIKYQGILISFLVEFYLL